MDKEFLIKTLALNQINMQLQSMKEEKARLEKELETKKLANTFKKKVITSKSDNFDVVSIARPIFWPERGYYEDANDDTYFQTLYKKKNIFG